MNIERQMRIMILRNYNEIFGNVAINVTYNTVIKKSYIKNHFHLLG